MCRLCLTAGLLLILASCDTTNPRVEPQPLIPLAVGNQWVMEWTDSLGFAPRTTIRIDTLKVTRDTLVDGEIWYEVKSRFSWTVGMNMHGSNWYTNRNDGLWNRSSPRRPFSDAFRVFASPDHVGETNYPKSGISTTLINDDAKFDLEQYGQVSTLEYELRLTSGYNPEDEDSAYPNEERGTFEFNGEERLLQHFSPSLGLVFLSGIWVRFDRDREELLKVGTLSFKLKEFIPALIE